MKSGVDGALRVGKTSGKTSVTTMTTRTGGNRRSHCAGDKSCRIVLRRQRSANMPRKAEYARAFDEQTKPGRRDSQGRLVLNDRDAKDKSALISIFRDLERLNCARYH
ncbi:hypothetical protein ALC53_01559 [Atta colombica]|uniref:Uncharacterized protein n=1 Tax=Atta colombica TaxID=520822 RepID=A0A195BUX4_9HYME|nr:hypothetical protein ALC53_01559 [Atta colombica]